MIKTKQLKTMLLFVIIIFLTILTIKGIIFLKDEIIIPLWEDAEPY